MSSETSPVDLGVISRIDALAAVLPPLEGAYVVDLGCGEGQVARELAARGARVCGYDPFIDEAADTWTPHGAGAFRLRRGRAETTPEPDGCADAVLFVYSLHHVPRAQLGAALGEACRLLKPTGRLCVVEPVAAGPMQYVSAPYHDETVVRDDAQAALVTFAAPAFATETRFSFAERTIFADFSSFAQRAMQGARFNDYSAEQVNSPQIKQRFDEMAAKTGGVFDQPVRINLFNAKRGAH
ncbi:MAG TPA: class I SAM-dependent methyltransferase [Reyranella sp.]|nr:class I SAM-dependent methyltransferase [Reyranella sp.]